MTDPVNTLPGDDPANWRAGVLADLLRISWYLGFIACVPSVYMAVNTGIGGIAVLDLVVLAVIFTLHRFDRIPYRWRAGLFCACGYALGVGLLMVVGTFSQLFFVAASVGATLLIGVRAGMIVSLLSAVTIAGFGLLGIAGPAMILVPEAFHAMRWLVIAMNFMLVSTLLTVGVGKVMSMLERAVHREVAVRISFEREHTLLRTLFDTLPDVVFTKDSAGRFTSANPAARAEWQAAHESEMLGKTVFDRFPLAQATALHADDMAVIDGRAVINHEVSSIGHDGNRRWYLTVKVPLRDSAGAIIGLIGVSRNVTERRELEEQLRQAQKMEAVGRLAGGITHDFNNLLTIIFGYSDVLRSQAAHDREIRESVDAISDAAARAAALTRQLLAFSRQSMLQPKVLDLNATITDTGRMLSRLIGEDVQFSLVLDPAIERVRVDPGQLDQVLMNLAVNARDAMPHGGSLTIRTQRTLLGQDVAQRLDGTPGPHVMIAVTDTGVGMSPEVLARIFEPFFTTKDVGAGTGLGLAMVFGIVRQSGGVIDVESTPGAGSTFRIYLPVVADAVPPSVDDAAASRRGTETVLLVEDDTDVRDLSVATLRAHGYTVLAAADGQHAIELAADHVGTIDLLVTDVVMPRMGGPELAAQVRAASPSTQVLFMSGYTDDAMVRQGVLKAEVAFLQKPYTPQALADKVRAVLDEARVVSVR